MSRLAPPAGSLPGILLALVLTTASCALPLTAAPDTTASGSGASAPLAVGTRFIGSLVRGDSEGAAQMVAANRQSEGTTRFLRGMAAALDGCASSRADYSSQVDNRGVPTISVVFTPACGKRSLMYPSYGGRVLDDAVARCEVSVESVAGEWKPRSDTTNCAAAATGS